MKTFFQLLESQQFANWNLQNTWMLIQADISGVASYLEAGHDTKAVLRRLEQTVKGRLEELEFYLNNEKK